MTKLEFFNYITKVRVDAGVPPLANEKYVQLRADVLADMKPVIPFPSRTGNGIWKFTPPVT